MIDAIKQHFEMILICGCMFLSGVGVGGAITDALNKWIQKGERYAKKMDSTGGSDRAKRDARENDDEDSR